MIVPEEMTTTANPSTRTADSACCAAVSAPGKVLLAGGYLVLDSAHAGVVVATSARFYALAQGRRCAGATSAEGSRVFQCTVRSPQFSDPPREYAVTVDDRDELKFTALNQKPNRFIDCALMAATRLSRHCHGHASFDRRIAALGRRLDVTVLGANDFYYSHFGSDSPNCAATGVALSQVRKTGLGSSAALTSCVVGALLRLLLPPGCLPVVAAQNGDFAPQAYLALVHGAAQYAHCLAQGKVGSGFDVASAVFGAMRYRRFPPAALAPLLALGDAGAPEAVLWETLHPRPTANNNSGLVEALGAQTRPFALPRGIALALADVAAGSHTPSMVARVLKWRESEAEKATVLWQALDADNATLVDLFARLDVFARALPANAYDRQLREAAISASDPQAAKEDVGNEQQEQPTVADIIRELKATLQRIRDGMRIMGEFAGVPIEPPEQSALLDACASVPGVVGVGVPGAGGYDALFVLYIGTSGQEKGSVLSRLRNEVLANHINVTLLPTEAAVEGLRDETENLIPGGHPLSQYLLEDVS